MDGQARRRERQLPHRLRFPRFQADLTVAFQPRQPLPTQTAHQFEVPQTAVPTVEGHPRGLKAARLRRFQHGSEVVVLAQAVLDFEIQPKIARESSIPVCPHQADEINPAPPRAACPTSAGSPTPSDWHRACPASCHR